MYPWIHLNAIDAARISWDIHDAWRRGDPCTMAPSVPAENALSGLSRLDVGGLLVPNLSGAWARMRQAQLDVALTREILRLRGASADAPVPLACPSWSFEHRDLADGRTSVTLHATPPWTALLLSPPLPLEHVEPGR